MMIAVINLDADSPTISAHVPAIMSQVLKALEELKTTGAQLPPTYQKVIRLVRGYIPSDTPPSVRKPSS